MAAKTLLTLEQFLALPERAEDGSVYELSEGELIKVPPPGWRHAAVLVNVAALLKNTLSREEYVVLGGDAGFLLNPNPESATVRGADVAVVPRENIGRALPHGWFPGAPLLAVEIVSPGNTAKYMQLKVKQYLKAGGLEVWLVHPDTRTVYVYSAERLDPQVFEENDELTSVLGKKFSVAHFFEV